jgi:hypothetical protein
MRVELRKTQPMHRKEMEGGPIIKLGGIPPMCKEVKEGGVRIKSRKT